jgi:RNA-binding protein Musashi
VTFESEDVVDRVCEIHYHMIKNKKVETKKAQPKEMVTTGAQMLQKRILLGGLGGIRLAPTSPLLGTTVATGNPLAAHLQTAATTATQMLPHHHHHHAAAAAAAAFQMQNAAQYQNCVQNVPAGGYGKIFATYPQAALHGFR